MSRLNGFLFVVAVLLIGSILLRLLFMDDSVSVSKSTAPILGDEQVAVFAGGCFWCMESAFETFPGVLRVVSGYTGGTVENPTYEQVSEGLTGHVEAIEVFYDTGAVSYQELLEQYWRQIDPTDVGGSFVDRGDSYRSVIFYVDEEQKTFAEDSKKFLIESGKFEKPIVTEIRKLGTFYPAEDYHQDYFLKNPLRYKYYRNASGRDTFIEKAWKNFNFVFDEASGSAIFKKPDESKLRETLSALAYSVTQEEVTEPAFNNEYWDNHAEGIYVDVVSGEPLFSSRDKYDSGTGWPSFVKPIDERFIEYRKGKILFYERTEVRSRYADSHLGHVFDDGPVELGGKRYCMNSAALRFVPKEMMEAEGYGEWLLKL